MEKDPLKGNGISIPLTVPASYQAVNEQVSYTELGNFTLRKLNILN